MEHGERQRTVARLEQRCREHGLALTSQRRLLIEAVVGRTDHPTADEVYESVRPRLPGLSRATVYRILDTLAEVGALRRVSHPGSVARFDPCTERHHHLLCTTCGTLVDIPDAAVRALDLPLAGRRGFEITDYSVDFRGTCRACRAGNKKREKERA